MSNFLKASTYLSCLTFISCTVVGSGLAQESVVPANSAAASHEPTSSMNSASNTQPKLKLSQSDADAIGHAIWRNECGERVEGLTSWNVGEGFPSLGIGHFIWYRESAPERFEESFPKLVAFLQAAGTKLPSWLTPESHCPWNSREEFLRDLNGKKLSELRALLAATVSEQTRFIVARLESALPAVLGKAAPNERSILQKKFYSVLNSGRAGAFALIDYVNFKGEGTNEKERYNGSGWGLLQVLEGMVGSGDPVQQFSESAAAVLARRVSNAPPERHEERWLPGWKRRVFNYPNFSGATTRK
ncbi:MAG TPA: hypothetical protein V6C97_26290 [Oculatellaceae cyanobacterium]